jgi:hypothetical protein
MGKKLIELGKFYQRGKMEVGNIAAARNAYIERKTSVTELKRLRRERQIIEEKAKIARAKERLRMVSSNPFGSFSQKKRKSLW